MASKKYKWISPLIFAMALTSCDSNDKSVEVVMVDIPVEDETKYPSSSESEQPQNISESQTANPLPSQSDLSQDSSMMKLSCQALWKVRNQVFHDKGYCFPGVETQAIFNNTGCQFDKAANIPLSDSEREYVKSIRTIEETKGCIKKPSQTPNLYIATPNEQYVEKMLEGSMHNDENSIQANKQYLESQPKPPKGDKKASREFNDEALEFFKSQQYDQAAILFAKAIQLDPADVEALNNYGVALIKSGDLNKATSILVKTLTIKPDRAPAWSNYGDTLALQGKGEMAVASYLNTYRFSKNRENTHKYFQNQLTRETNSLIRNALMKSTEKAVEMSFSRSPADSTAMEQ